MRRLVRFCAMVLAFASGWVAAYGPAFDGPEIIAPAAPPGPDARSVKADPGPADGPSPPPPPISRPADVTATALRPEPEGWRVLEEAAAADGLRNVYLSVPSDAPLTCGPRRRATLFLRCLEDRTAAYIAHDCQTPPGSDPGWDAVLRLDDGAPRQTRLEVDARGESFGHWSYRGARELAQALLGAKVLDVRFTDGSGSRERMRFPVAGLAEPLARLSAACNWSDLPPWQREERAAGTASTKLGAGILPALSATPPAIPDGGPAGQDTVDARAAADGSDSASVARPLRPSGPFRDAIGPRETPPRPRPGPEGNDAPGRAG